MEYVLSIFKLKKDKVESSKIFLAELHLSYQKEMKEVLKESGMSLDCSFINNDHLYIFKKVQDHNILNENVLNSKIPIYKKIRKWAFESIESSENIDYIAAFDLEENL